MISVPVRPGWLLVVAAVVLTVACLVVVATAPAAVRPWASFTVGVSLVALGIILFTIWRAKRHPGREDVR